LAKRPRCYEQRGQGKNNIYSHRCDISSIR
jgi:hypothetical protein